MPSTTYPLTWANALELCPYVRECDAMLIENFLQDLQWYMNANMLLVTEKVFLVSLYLTDHTKTWWHLQMDDNSCVAVTCWVDLAKEIMTQFHPTKLSQAMRTTMCQLKHIGFIEIVEKFSMLVLEVPQMDEEEKLHYFIEGLNHGLRMSCDYITFKTFGLQQPLWMASLIGSSCKQRQVENIPELAHKRRRTQETVMGRVRHQPHYSQKGQSGPAVTYVFACTTTSIVPIVHTSILWWHKSKHCPSSKRYTLLTPSSCPTWCKPMNRRLGHIVFYSWRTT